MRDRLHADKVRDGRFIIGREVIVLDRTESTNEVVRQMAGGDWPEGLCVFAEEQTAGRGQRGHNWESAPGKGLWFSILLRPKIDIVDAPRLSEWAARVVADTIGGAVKLPNDVYIGERKVAGVLVEMRAQIGGPHVAVVGIGVNVNHGPGDFSEPLRQRATSLAMIRRVRQDRHRLARELLQNLDRSYAEKFCNC
jgi:BirA family biotin operon repressor/biotin-[acetyl-CoA-carboxylase] ligase